MNRYFIREKEELWITVFDRTSSHEHEVRHDSNSFHHEDWGNGQWFGGAGTLSNPEKFFEEMAPYEVTEEQFNSRYNECLALTERG